MSEEELLGEDLEEALEEALEELDLQSLPEMEDDMEDPHEEDETETRVSTGSSRPIGSAGIPIGSLNVEIPEGASLRTLNLLTDPNEDDFAKYLVRMGRLGIDDVLEIVDSDGYVIGTKVLPHAESRYLEEVALEESARRMQRSQSAFSSDDVVQGILRYGSDDYDNLDEDLNASPRSPAEEDDEEQYESDEARVSEGDIFGEGGDGGPMRYPRTVESIYKLIEPDREEEFNKQIEHLNQAIGHTQHEICLEHKHRKILRARKFKFEKSIILEAISEAGILYLPGNFLHPIIGRRIKDDDLELILETIKELPDSEFKGFNLAYNEISDEGVLALAQFVQERPTISHLNLAHNDFTAAGLHTLVTYLINRPSLQSLKITGVKVGDEGINSITCLYMCGKGPRDIDLSETDMTMPGFQALCTAFQAVDEDDDYPKFLTKYNLPFSLETLARLKLENHENLKAQTYTHLCHSHFELIAPSEKNRVEEANKSWDTDNSKSTEKKSERTNLSDEITKILKDAFDTTLGAGDLSDEENHLVDLDEEALEAVQITEKAKTQLPTVEEFVEEHKMLKKSGCRATRPDGKPVIVCPSLYSLEIDEFSDEEQDVSSSAHKSSEREATPKRVNPMYMDTLVENEQDEEEMQNIADRDVADSHTAEKATLKFVRETFKEAGAVAGKSEYTPDSDMTQLLLVTILENAKRFLQVETLIEGAESNELTEAELRLVWEHSLKTTARILRPAIPPHCVITDDIIDVFVEEFLKISSGMFYKLIQVPFFQDLFERAATKRCIDATRERETKALDNYQPTSLTNMSYNKIVQDIILKLLEEVILRSAQIVGGGDPYNLRHKLGGQSTDEFFGQEQWPSIVDITEEMVEPLVEKFLEAGGILAQDALTFKQENDLDQDDGIEPAKQYLEGVFKQLANFLYQVKDDDEKLKERMEKPAKKFTFSTKPVRVVLNRPFFRGYEAVMASKLAAFLRNNDSIQCLHLRKWDLGEDGMINLMDGLLLNMNIVTLDLACNGIGAEGMRPLGDYIKRNQNLKHLLLNHNRLRNPGIQVLTNSIVESNLISLNVAFNDMTEVGLIPFLEAISKSNIYSLYILGNCFGQEACTILRDLFESKSLRPEECDVAIQDIDGEPQLAKNSQARDLNEWYEVPADVDVGLVCPPFYMELYQPPKVTIFGAVDVEM